MQTKNTTEVIHEEDFELQVNEYIVLSKKWYLEKYLQSSIDCIKYGIICILLFLSIYILSLIWQARSANIIMPFPLYVDHTTDNTHYIKSLYSYKKPIETVIAEYMLRRYLLLREEYYPWSLESHSWETLMLNISASSSYKIFEEYLHFILPSRNPDSPILKYRFHSTISTTINSIKMIAFAINKPLAAEVSFTTHTCTVGINQCLQNDRIAYIRFDISNIDTKFLRNDNEIINPFKFKVLAYKTVHSSAATHLE